MKTYEVLIWVTDPTHLDSASIVVRDLQEALDRELSGYKPIVVRATERTTELEA